MDAEEIDVSDLTLRQLLFLRAVWRAQRDNYNPPHFDLRTDSFVLLESYLNIESDAVTELINKNLLTKETHPHKLYSVTQTGRDLINVRQREGQTFGDGIGDLSESTYHCHMIREVEHQIKETWIADETHPATQVKPYHEPGDETRHDIVVWNNESLYAIFEIETATNDLSVSAPEDYDTMAASDASWAIWVTRTRDIGKTVIDALADPADDSPRITAKRSHPLRENRFNEAGFHRIVTINKLRTFLTDLADQHTPTES
jgi:hypothetical protein